MAARHEGESDQEFIDRKRRQRMATVDAMDPELRALVNVYGFHVVNSFIHHGVVRAKTIRHLVECVLDEFSPTRGSYSAQGPRSELSRIKPQD